MIAVVFEELEFGKIYTCKASGVTGRLVAVLKFEHSCVRVGLQQQITKDGTVPDVYWTDLPNLGIKTKKPGGYTTSPQQQTP